MGKDTEDQQRLLREQAAQRAAQQAQKPVTYIDTDGCEVTVTSSGHVFYNVSDWY